MISLYELKPRFQALLRPMACRLHGYGVSANQVTVAALALAVVAAGAIGLWPTPATLLLLPPVLFIRMALNALDGMLAREFQQPTPLGAMLNELGDVLADAALYLPLLLIPGVSATLVMALVWLALGFAPVLVTGPGLATTQAIGVLPVLYLFPALALREGYRLLARRMDDGRQTMDDSQKRRTPAVVRRLSSVVCRLFFGQLLSQEDRHDYP